MTDGTTGTESVYLNHAMRKERVTLKAASVALAGEHERLRDEAHEESADDGERVLGRRVQVPALEEEEHTAVAVESTLEARHHHAAHAIAEGVQIGGHVVAHTRQVSREHLVLLLHHPVITHLQVIRLVVRQCAYHHSKEAHCCVVGYMQCWWCVLFSVMT
jgi:hypothetical protein